ncbi:MAG: response regulator transcription factor [Leptolyngbyaceae cyanobacterium bins.302]|nr:response regulator transcription factor [Leptolyngbyaceae cyanobacterium bins.302]
MSHANPQPQKQRFLVVDDHEAILEGTIPALKHQYPIVDVLTAQDCRTAQQLLERFHPTLVVVDLSLPEVTGAAATPEVGVRWLEALMQCDSTQKPNILVLSTNIKPLVRLTPMINVYEGGFAAMDKSRPIREMLKLADLSLRGSIALPPEVRSRPELDSKWLEVLKLKFQQGLSDRAIRERMGIGERTLRNYWIRIQDAMGVVDDPDMDVRVQIELAARKDGLIH